MTHLPPPRPVRLAQWVCRLTGVAYLLIGLAVVGILVLMPSVSGHLLSGPNYQAKAGVLTSSSFWWDGLINPLFHGLAFLAIAHALGYLADLSEALIERDESPEPETLAPASPEYPELNPDDLQPLDR